MSRQANNKQSALILVDLQRALFEGPVPPHEGARLMVNIHDLIEGARRSKAPVIFVQHCSPEGTACAKGSKGWELIDDFAPQAGDMLLQKTRPSIFQGTGLQKQLDQMQIGRVILAGMKTEYCIDTSCRAAADLGYKVVLAGDAHTTMDSQALSAAAIIAHHNLTLAGPFAEVAPSHQIGFA
ncbi:cysteine hydrolase family protein [Lacibacterium aquatile]|uniref:Cysteine hydrolase family protein n=1 Tax=Lacibacterium aquatile TaxID=1168082 RepID=A0ABW5DPI5_9PROT